MSQRMSKSRPLGGGALNAEQEAGLRKRGAVFAHVIARPGAPPFVVWSRRALVETATDAVREEHKAARRAVTTGVQPSGVEARRDVCATAAEPAGASAPVHPAPAPSAPVPSPRSPTGFPASAKGAARDDAALQGRTPTRARRSPAREARGDASRAAAHAASSPAPHFEAQPS